MDKRGDVGGNCHTTDVGGIHVHDHGPHIFHTSDEATWEFVRRFATWDSFVYRPKARSGGRMFSFPINLMTLHQLWGVSTPEEAEERLARERVPIAAPSNLEEWVLSQVGREIYETFIRGYTLKQWMRDPKDLPASIVRRVPIRLTYDDNYFDDVHQAIPRGGYTQVFRNMLEGVEVATGVDFFDRRDEWTARGRHVVYTGPIDAFFGHRRGELEYRTLRFDNVTTTGDVQGTAVVNHPEESVPWTRTTEHKHFQTADLRKFSHTVYTREVPEPWRTGATPYYPIADGVNSKLAAEYAKDAAATSGVTFGGRLAEYRYYDMHQVIAAARHSARKLLGPEK